ncbi:hypothetical protein [Arthrobacter crystallopoietes]|uniref:Uncharacterized protein n=1 Tax=Crystallibacter crystallopoietes TaxID=37928 RepID=A0A1H1CQL9_9MICC|nr:hypothetical protein [Arthrobacter crystallopoietes]AUI50643.1 hypothetical protein AC20117_07190 [Arthrobacter crystallopoietes]SDQ66493.1 hypothetical protein SAMN04489742_2041 [Arthrobacter crystallopoietes]
MDVVEEMVGETMVALLAAAGVLHGGASLVVLATTKGLPAGTRAGLLAGCLLVPVIGPVLAVVAGWSAANDAAVRNQPGPGTGTGADVTAARRFRSPRR